MILLLFFDSIGQMVMAQLLYNNTSQLGEILTMSRGSLGCQHRDVGDMASSGQRPGSLLKSYSTQASLPQQRIVRPQSVNDAKFDKTTYLPILQELQLFSYNSIIKQCNPSYTKDELLKKFLGLFFQSKEIDLHRSHMSGNQ